MKSFNAELKQRLTEAGFNQREIEFGATTAQAKAALTMLRAAAEDQPHLMVLSLMMAQTMARVLAHASDALNLSAERITAASDVIGEAAVSKARQMAEQSGMASGSHGLDATPPAGPMDVN
jgi:hypothetical protein